MKIQDMEQQTGLDRATIRYYEKEGLIVHAREENGYRSYTQENLELLMKIKLLRQLGISLFDVKQLQKGECAFQEILDEEMKILDRRIQDTMLARSVCLEMKKNFEDYVSLDCDYYLRLMQAGPESIPKMYSEPTKN